MQRLMSGDNHVVFERILKVSGFINGMSCASSDHMGPLTRSLHDRPVRSRWIRLQRMSHRLEAIAIPIAGPWIHRIDRRSLQYLASAYHGRGQTAALAQFRDYHRGDMDHDTDGKHIEAIEMDQSDGLAQ